MQHVDVFLIAPHREAAKEDRASERFVPPSRPEQLIEQRLISRRANSNASRVTPAL
jgi:hypothetical protein